MAIRDLDPTDVALREQLAVIAFEAAAINAPAWLPTLDDARKEVDDATMKGQVARVLFDEAGAPIGWASCAHQYDGVWELHPMLIAPAHHRRGYGTKLARDIERQVASRGASVLVLSTSDSTNATSLSDTDLYGDPIDALANLTFNKDHPVRFWQRIGYRVVGVVPDAEGPGIPSISLARRPRG
ncbi:MAG: GNAT family N-acetyltransferase [Longimicrobiales bacterium]